MFSSIPRKVYFLAIVATIVAVIWQEWNASLLHNSPERFEIIYTADEASYFAPAQNFLESGTWKANAIGNSAYFTRTPGYGGIFLVLKFCLGKYVYLGLKCLQILGFFGSILLVYRICSTWKIRERIKMVTLLLFAFLPSYSGFIYYGLTEGITPFLLLWTTFIVSKSSCTASTVKTWQIVLPTCFLILVRPQLLVFVLAFLLFALWKKNGKLRNGILLGLLPLLFWMGRTAFISKGVPSLHPIYSATNNSMYRPTHTALTDLYRVWEWRGTVFHKHTGTLSSKDTNAVAKVMPDIPRQFRTEIQPILAEYQQLRIYQKRHFKNTPILGSFSTEESFIEKVKETRKKLIVENPMEYSFWTPMQSAKHLLVSSHLNLRLFQLHFRGSFFGEFLRYSAVFITLLSIILTLLTAIRQRNTLTGFIAFACIFYLCYLFWVQRFNEHRYLAPLLPVFLLLGTYAMQNLSVLFLKTKKAST